MNRFPLIVSYCTTDSLYVEAVRRLRDSLEKFDLRYKIAYRAPKGSWNQNAHYKADFILQMLQDNPEKNILWLDADAEVLQYPKLFESMTCDIASVVNKFGLLASVIYFLNTEDIQSLVKAWIQANKDYPDEFSGDQINLERVLKFPEFSHINFQKLPHEYSFIPGLMQVENEVIILQHQASREGRKLYP